MSGPAELAIATGVLVDVSLKASLWLTAGWGLTRLLRGGSAAQRHAIWATTLATTPLLAVFSWQRGPELAIDQPVVLALWAAGVLLALLPVAAGLVGLARLHRHARPHPQHDGVLRSGHVRGPITWGWLRPVIVLPASADGWDRAQREAAVAHERAHVARGDWAVDLLARLICAVFWFHPMAWLARRELAREAEHAADDAVLAQGVRPSDYAGLLLALASARTPSAALGVGSSLVGQRVRALLDIRSRSQRRWPAWVLALVLGAVCFPALGAWPAWSAPPEATLTCDPGPLP